MSGEYFCIYCGTSWSAASDDKCGVCARQGMSQYKRAVAPSPNAVPDGLVAYEEAVRRIGEGTFYEDYDYAAGPGLRALRAVATRIAQLEQDARNKALEEAANIVGPSEGGKYSWLANRIRQRIRPSL